MTKKTKSYITLLLWIIAFLGVGSVMGSLTKKEILTWYDTLNRSSLTPPNSVFGIAWTLLYTLIAVSGWKIWEKNSFPCLGVLKTLYLIQLLLNWSWTPLFFSYHLTGAALLCLGVMDMAVALIIYLSYRRMKEVSYLMTPYLIWILFATYLNLYVWQHN